MAILREYVPGHPMLNSVLVQFCVYLWVEPRGCVLRCFRSPFWEGKFHFEQKRFVLSKKLFTVWKYDQRWAPHKAILDRVKWIVPIVWTVPVRIPFIFPSQIMDFCDSIFLSLTGWVTTLGCQFQWSTRNSIHIVFYSLLFSITRCDFLFDKNGPKICLPLLVNTSMCGKC